MVGIHLEIMIWNDVWLVVWLPCLIFPYIGLLVIPIDELIFFGGVAQPPSRCCWWIQPTQKNVDLTHLTSLLTKWTLKPLEMIMISPPKNEDWDSWTRGVLSKQLKFKRSWRSRKHKFQGLIYTCIYIYTHNLGDIWGRTAILQLFWGLHQCTRALTHSHIIKGWTRPSCFGVIICVYIYIYMNIWIYMSIYIYIYIHIQ